MENHTITQEQTLFVATRSNKKIINKNQKNAKR